MAEKPDIFEQEEVETIEQDEIGLPAKVILFNDEWHSFDEVETQIMKAIKCSQTKAQNMTWDVHNNGKALVYSGDMAKCLKVSAILEEISLSTQIEY